MEEIGKNLHSLHFVTDEKALSQRRHRIFGELLKRFVDGTRWLNQRMGAGIDVERDKRDFMRSVVEPMDGLWLELTEKDKDYWWTVVTAVRMFKGRLV